METIETVDAFSEAETLIAEGRQLVGLDGQQTDWWRLYEIAKRRYELLPCGECDDNAHPLCQWRYNPRGGCCCLMTWQERLRLHERATSDR